jgi:excisionase family DNA binding protein
LGPFLSPHIPYLHQVVVEHDLPMDAYRKLLRVPDVAVWLGLKEGTIRLWIAQRKLPVVKLGRSVRVPADAVEKLILNSTVPERQRS